MIRLLLRLRRLVTTGLVLGETQRFLLLSIIIGILSGLVVVCFHISIEFFDFFTVRGIGHSWWSVMLWPAIGAGASFMLARVFFPAAIGSGVAYTKAALYVSDGYVPFSGVIGKFVASTLSIGSGNPMGPEDPSLQMGAGIASLLGRSFRLTRENLRLIAPVGAAAGIGAAFNTPITAVLFVMEEVVASWKAGVIGSIVLAATSAVVVSRWFMGDDPLYQVPEFELTSTPELAVYALVGVSSGVLSAWFTRFVARFREHVFDNHQRWRYALPALAGLVVGVVGTQIPEVLGAGYQAIDSALHDRFSWQFLLLLAALKTVTVAMCFSAGVPGGMFAPTLFIGAMIGGGIGGLAHEYWPFETSSAGAYVLVGIGTFFAGLFRAPMTSIFMVFEVSANYVIILPVMIANTLAFLISRSLQPESLFQIVGRQDGLELPSVEEQREAPVLKVEDAMNTDWSRVIASSASVEETCSWMDKSDFDLCLVSVYGKGWRWIRRDDLNGASDSQTLYATGRLRDVEALYPDISMDAAMRLLSSYPLLPVISRADAQRLLGTLSLEEVLNAYGIERGAGS